VREGSVLQPLSDHMVVCGVNPYTVALVQRLHCQVVVLEMDAAPDKVLVQGLIDMGAYVLPACDYRTKSVLDAAAVSDARAMVIVKHDDEGNLRATLAARELCQNLTIVVRIERESLGRQLESHLERCVVLNVADIGAGEFVSLALQERPDLDVTEVFGRSLVRRAAPWWHRVMRRRLATLERNLGGGVSLLPNGAHRRDVVLVDAGPADSGRGRLSWSPFRRARWTLLRLLLLPLAALRSGAADRLLLMVLVVPLGLALFLTEVLTTLTHHNFTEAAGLVAIPVCAATAAACILDGTIRWRMSKGLRRRMGILRGHYVVFGLGDIGTRVAKRLVDAGHTVIGVDKDPNCPNYPVLERLGVLLITGYASIDEVMRTAKVHLADCLCAVTSEVTENLEFALQASALAAPSTRIVVRMPYDELDRMLMGLRGKREIVSCTVGAPVATAIEAALDQGASSTCRRMTTSLGDVVIGGIRVQHGSCLVGQRVARIVCEGKLRIIAIRSRDGNVEWRPRLNRSIRDLDHVVVVSTPEGLNEFADHAALHCRCSLGGGQASKRPAGNRRGVVSRLAPQRGGGPGRAARASRLDCGERSRGGADHVIWCGDAPAPSG
jgi:Trk K+ transport system NAD-binding subunit